MTGDALRTLTRSLLGAPTAYSRLTDAEITQHVSEAATMLAEEAMGFALRSTVTKSTTGSQATVAITSTTDILRIIEITDTTNGNTLLPYDDNDVAGQTGIPTGEGAPLRWRLDSIDSSKIHTIRLFPVPAGVYSLSIRYVREPADIGTSAEITEFPKHIHFGFAYFAAWRHSMKGSEMIIPEERRRELKSEWDYHKNLYIRMQTSRNPLGERQTQTAEAQRGLTQ